MRIALIISASICAVGILSMPVTAQNTTTLRGLNTENDALAWQAVGRLDHRDGYCTATLITPDLLLTAVHCVYDGKGAAIAPEDLRFQSGLTHGKAAARRAIVQVEAHKVYDRMPA